MPVPDDSGIRYSASQRMGWWAWKRRVKLTRLVVGRPMAAAMMGPRSSLEQGISGKG
jgi:hypothetical protein